MARVEGFPSRDAGTISPGVCCPPQDLKGEPSTASRSLQIAPRKPAGGLRDASDGFPRPFFSPKRPQAIYERLQERLHGVPREAATSQIPKIHCACFNIFGVFAFLAPHDFQDVLEGSKIAHDDSHTGSKAPKSAPKGHRSPRWPKRAPRRRQDSPRQPEGPKTPRDGPRLSRGLQKTPKTAPGGPKRAHRRYWRVPKRFKRP